MNAQSTPTFHGRRQPGGPESLPSQVFGHAKTVS